MSETGCEEDTTSVAKKLGVAEIKVTETGIVYIYFNKPLYFRQGFLSDIENDGKKRRYLQENDELLPVEVSTEITKRLKEFNLISFESD